MSEYEVVAVVIEAVDVVVSSVEKGRSFELEIVELLRRLGFQVIHTGGRNDGEVDIRARFNGIDFIFQYKN
ncbi:hypothetical protein F8M41_019294 [Gigaspora margarita]|uniref:Restriction endonuclease type IV Mrr domain-containing protein n=1 Tax=Gigaspora margarita TaxID=4874 RepID=A0A8H4EKR1_GIGMA|nr:hypothetical protein F8M41_019294 [Gigaspora margarita]